MSNKNDKRIGISATILVHIAIIAALFLICLRTPLPLPGEEGVEIQLGNSAEGTFSTSAAKATPSPQPTTPTQPEETTEEEIVTTSDEEAPEIIPVEEEIVEPEEITPVVQEETPNNTPQNTEPVVEPEPDPEPVVNQAALYGGNQNSGGSDSTNGKGITYQPGNQGSETGSSTSTSFEGSGAGGDGISFLLGGRGKVDLPIPKYTSGDQGRVVVEILVNRAGNVVRATAGKRIPNSEIGTTTTDQQLWEIAVEAAKKSRFTPKQDAAEKQKGFIIYNFIRLN